MAMPWEEDYSAANAPESVSAPAGKPLAAPASKPWDEDYTQPTTSVFSSEKDKAEAVASLPELEGILAGEDAAKIAQVIPVLMLTTNPYEFGKILSENFPNIGVSQTPEGEFLAFNQDSGRAASINKIGLSQADLVQGAATATAFFPAAKMAGLATGLPKMMAAGGVTSAVTQGGIEGLQQIQGGEVNPADVAISGLLGAGSEVIMPAASAIKSAVIPAKEGVEAAAARVAVEGLESATGETVGLFQPQQTLDQSKIMAQRYVSQLEGGAKVAANALKKQNEQVFSATMKLIDNIGGENALTSGAKNFRTAAQNSIDSAKLIRSEKASPLYTDAFKKGADVDKTAIMSTVSDVLAEFPEGGKIYSAISSASNLIDNAKNLRQMHGAKLEIDALISGKGDSALDSTARSKLKEIQRSLLDQMDIASPAYAEARETFKAASPEVSAVADSILGRVVSIKDSNLKQVSKAIFDAQEVNPKVVMDAKRLISEADPRAWDDLLRVELQRRIGGISETISDNPEAVFNTPAQVRRAIFGNPAQRKVLLSGMDTNQRANFRYLEDVLNRAVVGRSQGSSTAGFQAVKDKLKGSALVAKDLLFSPIKSTSGAIENTIMDRNAAALAEAVFNPMWSKDFARIRVMNQKSPATAKALSQLVDEIIQSKYRQGEETE